MILHVDLNSYFATLEQQANPSLRGKPVGVAGKNINLQRTVVAAASIEAKRFGVKSGMNVFEARQLCPNIILVEADYDRYLECSQRFYRILEQYSPRVEIFSIDEAFLKLTDPNLQIPSECSECSGHSDENSDYSDRVDHSDRYITTALAIKTDVRRELGEWVTASIGIAPNKFLAKLASESFKPDGLTTIFPYPLRSRSLNKWIAEHQTSISALTKQELLERVKLSDFCGIGPRILRRLNALGIYTPEELTAASLQLLVAEFGHHWGRRLWEMGQGIDYSPIVIQGELPLEKSFGHSYTLPKWASDFGSAWTVLSRLSDQVARRMRKAGFLGRTLFAHLGFDSPPPTPEVKGSHTSGVWVRETYKAPINDGREIFRRSRSLLEKRLRATSSPPGVFPLTRIRHIGLCMTNLVPAPGNFTIFPHDQKRQRILPAIDRLWDRYGPWSVVRADQLAAARILEPIPDGRSKRPILR